MKKLLIAICFIFVCLTIVELSLSFGVFESKLDGDATLNVAKWHIYVNDTDINGKDNTFYIDNITYTNNDGVSADKFAPGVTGEFILVIDPTDTEVAFKYNISFDTATNLYEQIKIDNIEAINDTEVTVENGVYSRIVSLDDIANKKQDMLKVTFSWINDDIYNESDSALGLNKGSSFEIPINITFEQYIG